MDSNNRLTTSVFRIFIFKNDVKSSFVEVCKTINDETKYAEDLIISCAKDLKIGPVSRHLFGIYERNENLWLSPNEEVLSLISETYGKKCEYEFRVRYKPYSISYLRDLDKNAFTYYFNQIRYDFIHEKPDSEHKERVLGLVIADIVRYSLEMNIARDVALEEVNWDYFFPIKYPIKKKSLNFIKSKEIKETFCTAWHCSQGNADFTKKEYMESIAFRMSTNQKPLLEDYGVEKYRAQKLSDSNYSNQITAMEVEVQCRCYNDFGVFICPFGGKRTKMCSISELCFISIQTSTNTVEISRRNGTPLSLCFSGAAHLKSFVSCLDGLYRLSEKWTFNLCKEISSPSLEILRNLKCHGPVDNNFAKKKLRKDGKNEIGTYLIRESFINYDEYFLDVIVAVDETRGYIFKRKLDNFVVKGRNEEYSSISDMVQNLLWTDFRKNVCKLWCLRPSEFEKPLQLLLCRDNDDLLTDKKSSDTRSNWPRVIPKDELKFCEPVWKMNSNLEVGLAKLGNEEIVAKVIKNDKICHNFLETLSDWVKVKSDCIITIQGVCLHSPLALVVEYLPHGPLDAFLVTNKTELKVVDLIESIAYAARALWYLEENNLIHGRIRCHNLLVSKYDSNSLRVKLSDPISDGFKSTWPEGAWIAPEAEKTIATDVWAFGTTVWEIFSYGSKPEYDRVGSLDQPLACPSEVWNLIMECWTIDPQLRKKPQIIVRDVNQLFYEVYNCRRSVSYAIPIYRKPIKGERSGIFYDFFKGFGSKNFNSAATLPMDEEPGDIVDLRDPPENSANSIASDTWIIEINQLKTGKVLGSGYYGEVVLAVLSRFSDLATENVAVKRIKLNKDGDGAFNDMKREINIMKKLRHKNIVEIKGYVEEPHLMLVMEYLQLGSLVAYLQKFKHANETGDVIPFLKFACDIAEGMEYLEIKKVIHRDLAARNILVSTPNLVKISDFGLAQCIHPKDTYYRMTTNRDLPIKWYAPESIVERRFSHKSDVWSYGVTLWQLYSYGEDPYYVGHDKSCGTLENIVDVLRSGNRLSCPKECPNSMYELMCKCWKFEAKDRPNFTSLKKSIKELMN